jgi:hypothetical protein
MAQEIQPPLSKKIKDIRGMKFGMLAVTGFAGINARNNQAMWDVLCDCGATAIKDGADLRNGGVKSCGCSTDRLIGAGNTKHGDSHGPLHRVWGGMLDRCERENNVAWKDYGGRGIKVCERWHDYRMFKEDMGSGYAKGLQIDRINNDGNYEPGNCKWSTCKEQGNNRRSNRRLQFDGLNLTISEWSDKTGFSHGVLCKRLKLGWPIEKVLTHPLRPY